VVTALPAGSVPFIGPSLDGSIYFGLFDANSKGILWKSDGTAAGTQSLFDFNPTENVGGFVHFVGATGDRLLMVSWTSSPGFKLWSLDTKSTGGPGSGSSGDSDSSGGGCAAGIMPPATMVPLFVALALFLRRHRKAQCSTVPQPAICRRSGPADKLRPKTPPHGWANLVQALRAKLPVSSPHRP
jgi:ELWxxDGT repeat protein